MPYNMDWTNLFFSFHFLSCQGKDHIQEIILQKSKKEKEKNPKPILV